MTELANHRQQHQQDELCGASIRALTGLSDLRHRGRSLFLTGKRVHTGAPHLQANPLVDNFRSQRGIADGIAMRLRYSDDNLHLSLYPQNSLQALLFDLLEQLRVEALVDDAFPGIRTNLYYRFRTWSLQFHAAGHTETQLGLLIYTVAQIAWSRVSGYPTLGETEDLIEVTRGKIAPVIGSHLYGLRINRFDQKKYAEHALRIAQVIEDSLSAATSQASHAVTQPVNQKALSRIALAIDFSDEAEDSNIATVATGSSKVLNEQHQGYKIFTREYDREIVAASQVREAELREFRIQLDRMIQSQGINIPRLARHISELLATPRRDGWIFGEETGLLDGRRLTQLVTAPRERRLFRKDRHLYKNDCLVSFLIDCSGSMKAHIEYIAMLVDIFARALDQAEIASEILGFTTANWTGGAAYKAWLAQGRPEHPGRLNERCHLLFKNADTAWRRSR
ncbi:MAG: cobalt chelatase, partial [Gammaproteobacteria bacterium]|nr:cobalt chelatase [Gammaproteobacteria bacterium]